MNIAIIGAGRVGTTLAHAWKRKDHDIFFGVRNPNGNKSTQLVAEGFQVGTVASASSFGDIVVLATPWRAAQDAINAAGDLSGKVIIDCTNPLKPDLSGLDVPSGSSGAAQIASWAKGARVFKAFNQTGTENMAEPVIGSHPAVMFVAGDDGDGKATVIQLVSDVGFEAVDAGPLSVARSLEELAVLWIHLAYNAPGLDRNYAFAILRR
jgi:predicted dinucleotide-binding enzyme